MKLIFSHIPKTAGTSVRTFLSKGLRHAPSGCRSVVAYAVGGVVSPNDFPRYELPSDWNFLVGHVTLENFLRNPGVSTTDSEIIFLSFVRDPVDRLISLTNYVYSNPNHPDHERVQSIDMLSYLSGVAMNNPNLQSRYLETGSPQPAWRFVLATVTNLEGACDEVLHQVGGDTFKKESMPKENVTSDRRAKRLSDQLTKDDIPGSLLAQIKEKNARDLELFEEIEEAGILRYPPKAAQ